MKLSAGWFRALIFILNPDGNICISPTVVLCEGFFVLLAPVNIANLRNPLKLIFSIMPISEYYQHDRRIQKPQPGRRFPAGCEAAAIICVSRARVCVFISFGWRGLPCFPIFISPFHTLLPSCCHQHSPSGQRSG